MSTRKDGLSLRTVSRTVRHILDAHGVEVVGGNARVLHVRRRDGHPDVGAARASYGFTLTRTLAVHGFTLRARRGAAVVDLLECRGDDTSTRLAERVAARDARDARAEWLEAVERGADPVGRSEEEHAAEIGEKTYLWAVTQTAARLRSWLAAP